MELDKILYEITLNSIYLGNFLIFSLLVFYILKFLLNLKRSNEKLIGSLVIFSLSIAVSSLYSGESYGLINDLIYIWAYSILSFFLLLVGHYINDFLLFHKVKNIKEISEGNLSILIVEGAHFLAIGTILNSVINNFFNINENQIKIFIYITFIFTFIQFLLILGIIIYRWLLLKLTNLDLINLIYKNNISAGVLLFSNYTVISFLLASAFAPEKDLLTTLVYSLFYFVFSIFIILVFKIIIDLVLIPDDNIKSILENDRYKKAIFIELITLSMIFIYHFLSS
ncbi:MAG: hypothetical protein DSY66_01150 [Persephonella sp.]|nr:MAG: hypothetical protein DSY53_00725 [Persephonella sp.]RUM61828.1 MAG: hypothetical protein DSY66_01150 [Persephonella sp.]